MNIASIFSSKKTLGIYLILIGVGVLLTGFFPYVRLYIFLSLLLIISINLMILTFTSSKNRRLLIPGITLLLLSLFFLVYNIFLTEKYQLTQIWPILGTFPAISMITYYFLSNNKNPGVIIPGFFLGLFSIMLMLITTNIIKMRFTHFLGLLLSCMTIITGIFLIITKDKKKNEKK